MSKNLVIVESLAKSKTISKFLGKNYHIVASMGHLVDLPKSKMGVDVENNFTPEYKIIPKKKKIMAELKKQAKTHENIYLAADPDREGEAICWHLYNELKDKVSIYRVSFNEITKSAILEAFKNPHNINKNKVDAQQARRILDRLVGYSLSPLLWKKVTRGLSAGRVQSVAVRLMVEREKEIEKFKPKEYWDIECELSKKNESEIKKFKAKLFKINNKKERISNERKVNDIKSELKDAVFFVDNIKKSKKRRFPKPPFKTSTLQQSAYNTFKFTARKTMRIAQQLYEGIELKNSEVTGLITYMRTDSFRISKQARDAIRKFIKNEYGEEYLSQKPKIYKSTKGAQEAHEAIRPTYVDKTPDKVKEYLSKDQYKLYNLIWQQFTSSQMQPALFENTQILIKTSGDIKDEYLFKATGSVLKFDGYLKINKNQEFSEVIFPDLNESEELTVHDIISQQHFTNPPPRFTEASLIKELEKRGIGRPSTYAPTIYTIVLRDYVRRFKSYLMPTDLGKVVTELLVDYFPKILDIEFTAGMEEKLDLIEAGEEYWVDVLKNFYVSFKEALDTAKVEMKKINKKVIPVDKKCPKCGAQMVIKWGRWGKFLSCSRFPDCKYSESLTTGVKCPIKGCDGELVQRRSKKGKIFYGCSNYPKCKYTTNKLPEE